MNAQSLAPPLLVALLLAIMPVSAQTPASGSSAATWTPQVPFVPTPDEVVDGMLDIASVTKSDVVYDLGSGDGRIVIAAARKGARAIGVDINPERTKESNDNARRAGVTSRVKFLTQDLFATDLRDASVVTLYLLPSVNMKLRPKLLSELKPGSRVVSHSFDMGDWEPARTIEVNGSRIYLWIVPPADSPLRKKLASLETAEALR